MRKVLVAFAAALAFASQMSPALAQPHDHGDHGAAAAVQTIPADGAMGATPQNFSATFAHPMRLTSLVITPQRGDPSPVDVSRASSGATVSVALPALRPGNYTITWTASGDDNHTMTGRVRYMVH